MLGVTGSTDRVCAYARVAKNDTCPTSLKYRSRDSHHLGHERCAIGASGPRPPTPHGLHSVVLSSLVAQF
jgi:hypothetical protein